MTSAVGLRKEYREDTVEKQPNEDEDHNNNEAPIYWENNAFQNRASTNYFWARVELPEELFEGV